MSDTPGAVLFRYAEIEWDKPLEMPKLSNEVGPIVQAYRDYVKKYGTKPKRITLTLRPDKQRVIATIDPPEQEESAA